MIRDAEIARQAVGLAEQANKLLGDSLELVRSNRSKEEYEAYRRGMAQVTGRLFFLVMEPIYQAHLSLAPDTPADFLDAGAEGRGQRKAEIVVSCFPLRSLAPLRGLLISVC